MSSNSQIDRQWPDQDLPDSSKSYALSGRIMLASIIILFVVVIFLVILHLYARWYLLRLQFNRRNRNHNRNRNRSTRIVFYVDNNPPQPSSTVGLNPTIIKSLPMFVYSKTDNDVLECAVCLSEFETGETGRVLPKCKHSFHTGCIDMWFFNNSTCPLCRSSVEAVETTSLVTSAVPETGPGSSASVETTSFGGRMKRINNSDVRIDIPNRNELRGGSDVQLTSPGQGFRSPGSRLLSRIISMSWKSPVVSPSTSGVAAELDAESASHELSRQGSGR